MNLPNLNAVHSYESGHRQARGIYFYGSHHASQSQMPEQHQALALDEAEDYCLKLYKQLVILT